MKNLILIALLTLGIPLGLSAQKFGYVDSEYILSQLPEYKSAQKQLDDASAQWQKELETKLAEVDRLYREYQDEKPLLSEEMRKKREDFIAQKEKSAKDFQKDKFGPEGELFKKRSELMKPIQDRVFEAIQKVAKKNGWDFVFDKSGDMIMLYSNAKFDASEDVLEELGVTVKDPNKTPGSPKKPTPR